MANSITKHITFKATTTHILTPQVYSSHYLNIATRVLMPASPSIKLLMILTSATAPSSRVRCRNLIPALEQQNISCHSQVYPKSWRQRFALFRLCKKADVVLIQKKLLPPLQFWLLRLASQILIFDFDDAIYLRQKEGCSEISKGRLLKFKRTVKQCDHVIAGNRLLSAMAKPLQNKTHIIPSAIAVKNISRKDHSQSHNGPVVIGWVGTAVNLPYLALLSPILNRLNLDYDIELRIICNESIEIPGVTVKFIPWQLATQEQEIAQFDIGVMPLPDSEHASGKCGYKALQYMAAAVPAVASNVGINNEIIDHVVDGLLAGSISEFYPALKHLIESPEERQRIGLAGQSRIAGDYAIDVVSKQLADIINKAVSAHE